jgi:cupin fold WbuC family metalloprotein
VARGIDLAPGVWHSITALTPYAVTYEVKPGPWEATKDKEFAPWAPAEGDPAAAAYLQWLLR